MTMNKLVDHFGHKPVQKKEALRGSGRTTAQMEALAIGGLFVSDVNMSLAYNIALARSLDRADIRVVSPQWIMREHWRGLKFPGVTVDHSFRGLETQERSDLFSIYIKMIRDGV